jgi:hypothetical protein
MKRWTGRKVSRNSPANAITNFLDIEENRILLIGYEMFSVNLFSRIGSLSKLDLLSQIYNFMLIITNKDQAFADIPIADYWLPLQK